MPIQKARKYEHRIRLGLAGPTGSGKTYTALRLATEIAKLSGGRVGLIDTEHGSASLYADEFDFDTIELVSFAPDRYIEAIREFETAGGYAVVIVDSLTHAWAGKDGALEQVDRKAGQAGNSFTAWRDVTPQHTRLVEGLLGCKFHLIGTLRSKMAYEVDTDPKTHKVSVRKLGLQPIQREGMEYEFDVFADLDVDNTLNISKTRFKDISGLSVQKAGEDLARQLHAWAQGEAAPVVPVAPAQATVLSAPVAQQASTSYTLDQLAGLGDTGGVIGRTFLAYVEDRGLKAAQLGVIASPKDGKATADITGWLARNPGKTLKDLVELVIDRLRDEEEAAADDAMDEAAAEKQAALANG